MCQDQDMICALLIRALPAFLFCACDTQRSCRPKVGPCMHACNCMDTTLACSKGWGRRLSSAVSEGFQGFIQACRLALHDMASNKTLGSAQ